MKSRPVLLRLIVVALVVVVPFACRRPAAPDAVEDTVAVAIGRDETEPGPEVVLEPEPDPDPEPPKDEQVALAVAGQTFPDGKSWTSDPNEEDASAPQTQPVLPDGKSSTAQTSFPDGKSWTPVEPALPEPAVVEIPEPEPEPGPEPEPEPVIVEAPEPEPEPVVVEEPEPEPEPEPVIVETPEPEPEPVVVEVPEPEPEPVVVEEPEPEPEPEPVIVETPEPEPERLAFVDTSGPGPVITVLTPAARSFYTTEVIVEGQIQNSPDSRRADAIEQFTYQVATKPELSGPIYYNERDGEFWFSFLSTELEGTHTLEITAQNSDGAQRTAAIELHDGNLKPIIQLDRPTAKLGFGSRLLVRGRAHDPSDDLGQSKDIESIEYEVYPVGTFSARDRVSGNLEVAADGSFTGVIQTRAFEGDIDVIIKARTSGGKTGENTVTLTPAEGDIPSFRAIARDGRVDLAWTELPDTVRYDAFWAPDTPDAEWIKLANVESPTTIAGLDNAQRYRFQLRSTLPGDDDEVAAVRLNVPLGAGGIVLDTDDQYRRVSLTWNSVTGAEGYRILRADLGSTRTPAGPSAVPADEDESWHTIAVVDGQEYNDIGARIGMAYAYRVGPNYANGALSVARAAQPAVMPANPVRTASELDTSAAVNDVATVGAYALYIDRAGLHVVDISTPELPAPAGMLPLDSPTGLAVRDETAVVTSPRGAHFIDLNDTRNPRVDSLWMMPDATGATFVNAGTEMVVAIAAAGRGVAIVDASGATAQTELSQISVPDPTALAADGRYLFIGDASGVVGMDLSQPTRPREIGRIAVDSVADLAFDVSTGLLAIAGQNAIHLYRVGSSDTRPFVAVAQIPIAAVSVQLYETAERVYLMAAGRDGDVQVLDATDPYAPVFFAGYEETSARVLTPLQSLSGETIVVVGETAGIRILDLFVVGRSHTAASTITGGGAAGVDLAFLFDQPFAFVADGSAGVAVYPTSHINAIDGSQPILRLPSEYAIRTIVDPTDDRRIFVADGRGGLRSFAIRQEGYTAGGEIALGFEELLEFTSDGTLRDLTIVHRIVENSGRTLAYLANGEGGFVVADVTDPGLVRQIGSIVLRDVRSVLSLDALGILGGSRFAVATDTARGVLLIDVSDPTSPVIAAERDISGARQVANYRDERGDYLVVLGSDGVTILDASDGLGEPVGHFPTRFGEHFSLSGSLLVLAEGFRGVSIVDLSDPSRPTAIGTSDLDYAADVAVSGSTLFVVDNQALHVLDLLVPPWLTQDR